MLRKLFPSGVHISPAQSFNIVFFAEGFRANEQASFTSACVTFYHKLVEIPPFNITRYRPEWLTIYTRFSPSANAGPAIGTAIPGRTIFESAIQPSGALTVNGELVNAAVTAETVRDTGADVPLSEYCVTSSVPVGLKSTLIVVLLPSLPAPGAEVERIPGSDDVYFIATTQTGMWHQVVLRAVCKIIGLQDEFEVAGPAFLEPTTKEERFQPFYNVQYLSIPPLTNGSPAKWRSLFGPAAQSSPASVHPRTGNVAVPDNTINATPTTPDRVEYFEGAAGFRTKVYRSAKDCLMRRRIGDPALPLRNAPVPLCVACRRFLYSCIG